MAVEIGPELKVSNDRDGGIILLFSSSVKKLSALSILTKAPMIIKAVAALATGTRILLDSLFGVLTEEE
jgi:hypothetical protein